MTLPNDIDACTASGQPIYYRRPHLTAIIPSDLRIQLSRICRYNGVIYVDLLQHSALCAELARLLGFEADIQAAAGGHDLQEAYLNDLHPAIKKMLVGWDELEIRWERHVHDWLGVRYRFEVVKHIDNLALVAEMRHHNHPAAAIAEDRVRLTLPRDGFGKCGPDADLIELATRHAAVVFDLDHDACWRILVRAIPKLGESRPP